MVNIKKYPPRETWTQLLMRPTDNSESIEKSVKLIFKDVEQNGDTAIKKYSLLYDKTELSEFQVTNEEFKSASQRISPKLKAAIQLAKENIEIFHRSQLRKPAQVETTKGVLCWLENRPIEKVGLYIPGGTAPLFSTVLMLAIPAKIAECKSIILCTPPNTEGKVAPEILYTAQLCGISRVFKIGGIQAVAAMTFGTNSIPKVNKIFGPGNQYVTKAKQMATQNGVAIDMPAGPSELLVVADENANSSYIASDLLSQAEHGIDSQVILVSTSLQILRDVNSQLKKQLPELDRKDIAAKALKNSIFILVDNDQIAIELINFYGPEHFIICSKNEDYFIKEIINAGSVFIGKWSPESAGDYASGTNHTLPTNGYSKSYSGVNLDSFMKTMSFQKISKKGLKKIGPAIEIMADAEGLQAHKNAVTLRLKDIN